MTRRTRLEVTRFEDRVNPVLGSFDAAFVADVDDSIAGGTVDFTGVVDYANRGTGSLLDRGAVVVGSNHILTAAHVAPAVGDIVSFYRRLPDGNLNRIDIPVIKVWVDPSYTGNPFNNSGDVAIATLAAIAPFGVTDYPIYTTGEAAAASEVNRPFIMAGYGLSGTGTSGQATDQELQRMTITASGGSFRVVRPDTGAQSSVLAWNATAAQIQTAFTNLGLPAVVRQVTVGPLAPTATVVNYEVLFSSNTNLPRMSFQSNPVDPLVNGGNFGSVAFTTLVNGGIDAEFQRITLAATGGTFRLGFGTSFTAPLPFNATAGQIQTALESLNTPGPGPGEVTVRPVTSGPNAGSFQVSFDSVGFDIPLLLTDATALTGTVNVITSMDGGRRVFRMGRNEYDGIAGGTLVSDFDGDGTDEFEGQGDSGSAGFIDTGNGRLAIASVVSYGGFVFGDTENNTRAAKYSTDILNEAANIRLVNGVPTQQQEPVTLDMQYQVAGNDGVPDTITVTQTTVGAANTPVIQIWVQSAGGARNLYYQDILAGISSIRLLGSADNETFVIDPAITKLVSVNGGFGTDTLVGPTVATAWRLTGANMGTGDTASTDFDFQGVENLVGRGAADTFSFTAAGSLQGTIDGGTGLDTLDYSARSGATVAFTGPSASGFSGNATGITGGFTNIDGFTANPFAAGDVMVTPDQPGVFTHTGTGGTYTNLTTGQSIAYAGVDVLTGGAADDTFNVKSLTAALTIDGASGNDTINVAADAPADAADHGPITASLVVLGGIGVDTFRFNGTAASEAVTARVSGPNTGDVLGMTPAGVTVAFASLEQFLFDGRGGANSFTALDISGTSLGTPTDPGSGIVYAPTGPNGGGARINGVTVGAIAVGGFTVNGDPDHSGDLDVLTVVGTSAAGLQSGFGEAVIGDGRDRISVTDFSVSVKSVQGGQLLPVTIGYTNGFQTFSTLYVAGGNERGNEGDTFDLPTTLTFNLVADGMLPSPSARPGDRLILSAPGGADSQIETDSSLGPTQTRFTARSDGSSAGALGFESGVPGVPGAGMIAVGSDVGYPATVRVFDRITGDLRFEVTPFPGFNDGVKVASGDVNGDGIADLVVGAGPNGGPRVAVYDGLTGQQLYDFLGYEESFRGGVTVAVGDIDLDGYGDLILGTGVGGGPRVRVLSGKDLTPIRDVFPYEISFRGGVSVAAGDVNGDGVPDLITSTGAGGGPRVVVVDGRTSAQLASFFVFDKDTRIGFTAAGGDVNGDGFADIIVGSGQGSQAEVRVFSGFNRAQLNDFYVNDPFDPTARASAIGAAVRVAVADTDGDGVGDIITGLGPGGDAVVRTYKVTGVNPQTNALFPTLTELRRQDTFDFGYNFGIFVGASD